MAIGIPAKVAYRMANDVERSFVVRSVETTYPKRLDEQVASVEKYFLQ
jgi:hypothetical protein